MSRRPAASWCVIMVAVVLHPWGIVTPSTTCGNLRVQARKSKVSVDALPTTFEHDVKIETRKLFASIEHRRKKYEKGRKREDVRTRVSHALLTDSKTATHCRRPCADA